MANYSANDLGSAFLMHYGILGMRWGVRRYQNLDGTLTPLGKAGDWAQKTQSSGSKYDSIKADAMAANGGGEVARLYSKNRNTNCFLCSFDYEMRRRGYDTTAAQYDFPSATRKAAYDAWTQSYLPMRKVALHDPDAPSSSRDDAFDAAYDQVQTETYAHYITDITDVFPDAKPCVKIGDPYNRSQCVSEETSNAALAFIANQGDGARGQVLVQWANSSSGHAMAYEVVGNSVYLIDAQTGEVFNSKEAYSARLGYACYIAAYRVDNLEVNDDLVKEKGLITNSAQAQMSWNNTSIAKQMTLDKIDKQTAEARKSGKHEYSIAEQGYAFISKMSKNVSSTISDISKSASSVLNNAASFISTIFK